MLDIPKIIAEELGLSLRSVQSAINLMADGATIPFISRYRKEATGSLDEVELRDIEALNAKYQELEKRKSYILETIEAAGALTDELRAKIEGTTSSATLEDLFMPYKPKRRTRATVAREHGLEPLAKIIMAQTSSTPRKAAEKFVKEGVADVDAAIEGAKDIIAEWVSESERARAGMRSNMLRNSLITARIAKGKEREAQKFRNYDGFRCPLRKVSSHQYLALRRGEREGLLRVAVEIDEAATIRYLEKIFVKADARKESADIVREAVADAFKRLLFPSIDNEVAAITKKTADTEAIRLFADNLRELLLAPPLGHKNVMGIDPGFRTGCKVVCLDAQGNLLHHCVIFPQSQRVSAATTVRTLVDKYAVEAIAVGNGTASRETEQFLKVIHYPREVQIHIVDESGASIYSASELARQEMPNHDVTVRGAVSIGRRLIDPLAELVKIEPRSIGVGQYQHDVDQAALKDSLDYTVMSCVNSVGVNVNTASPQLLSYISGIGPQLAINIVNYRAQEGDFTSRAQLKKVPRLGPKAYEQAAGFLRIPNAESPLDNTAVHPESYPIVARMAKDLGVDIEHLLSNAELIDSIDLNRYVSDTVGLPTLTDIIDELKRPGRDPRSEVQVVEFDPTVTDIEDIRPGMELNGIVKNITAFGAFVDIGVKESGLVHVSQMGAMRVSSPAEVVKVHQPVRVRVLDVDLERGRISLTMKGVAQK